MKPLLSPPITGSGRLDKKSRAEIRGDTIKVDKGNNRDETFITSKR